jgi:hypothetical protein
LGAGEGCCCVGGGCGCHGVVLFDGWR